MAKLFNLARVSTATTGTGTITLGAAVSGYLTFALAGVANGDVVSYGIKDGANSEVGTGTYTSAGLTLTRTPTKSTNANAAISLSGSAEVFITARAEDINVLPGYLSGLTLSTAGSSATFGIAVGAATDSTSAGLMSMASAYTKTTSAWAVGTAAGSLDTGAIANSTWYHVHLIKRLDTGVVDVLISLSATAPTMPTNYTLFRRIGSMKTNGSAQWTAFTQNGDTFYWGTAVQDANGVTYTTVTTITLSTPLGVKTMPLVRGRGVAPTTTGAAVLFYSPDEGTPVADTIIGNVSFYAPTAATNYAINITSVYTDTSSRLGVSTNGAAGGVTAYVSTYGYIDNRGK